jgi:hypothetical protein
MTHAPNDYALIIGIDDYPNWAKGSKSLKGAVKDAETFRKWLIKPTGGGMPPEHARLIRSTKEPIAPLQQVIDDEFKVIRALSTGLPRRRFYFYFSGHGHSPAMSGGRQALCLANWSLEDQGAALQLESYLNASVGCLNFEEGLFFLDCCRVRETTPLGKSSDLECGDPKLEGKQHITFYASEHYKPGYEAGGDDARGYFSQALINILEGGTIEALELERRLGKDVPDLAKGKNQVARALRYCNQDIFLGPPDAGPGQDGDGEGPPPPQARLTVILTTNLSAVARPGEPPPPAPGNIIIYRGDRFVVSSTGGYTGCLPTGPYTIRIAHGEAIDDHAIELDGDMGVHYDLPRRNSAAPLSSTVDKREIITDPIVKASKEKVEGDQSIFIVSRTKGVSMGGQLAGELRIESYGSLNEAIVEGRNLFTAPPNTYTLRYSEADGSSLCLAVPVAEGWDTQVFFVEDRGRPILERASIFMQPASEGFNPADALIDAYELALADLVTDGPGPAPYVLQYLLEGKFENPLFGLVGAHFLVRELAGARERQSDRYQLLEIVIGNMTRLLGERDPDVLALRVLRARFLREPIPREYPTNPPLLKAGFLALINATASQPELFEDHFDSVALGLVPDSPWSCWREPKETVHVTGYDEHASGTRYHQLSMKAGARIDAIESILIGENFEVFRDNEGSSVRLQARGYTSPDATSRRELNRLANTPNWVVDAMRAELVQSERTKEPINMPRLVRRLGLPRGLLEQALRLAQHEAPRTDATPTDSKRAAAGMGA